MREWFQDWRFFVLIYILSSGVWSVLAKYAAGRLNWATQTFVAVLTASLVVALFALRGLQWQSKSGIAAAVAGGVLGGISSLAFYKALGQAPASVVFPLCSLYLVLTVVLAYLVLGETIGLRQIVGIILGLISITLLAK